MQYKQIFFLSFQIKTVSRKIHPRVKQTVKKFRKVNVQKRHPPLEMKHAHKKAGAVFPGVGARIDGFVVHNL